MQRKNINKFVLDTVIELVGKVVRRPRETWITEKVIHKGERRNWKNVNKVEGKKNYRKPRKLLTGNAEKAKKKKINVFYLVVKSQRA